MSSSATAAPARTLRVIIAQNYSLTELEAACSAGEKPLQQLWGLDALRAAGMQAYVLGSPRFMFLRWLSGATRLRLGDFPRQLTLLREARARKVDVIVCAETSFARGLGLLRRWRLLRIPLVGVEFPYEPRTWFTRYTADGFDEMLCLSSRITDAFDARGRGTNARTVRWGPDLSFAGYRPADGSSVVSTGRSHRDHRLLARAAKAAGVPLLVHMPVDLATHEELVERIDAPYSQVLADTNAAAIIAIPLLNPNGCTGLTELSDALALAKPILMTRNPYIDADIEAIGCGRWMPVGDQDAWTAAISELMADSELRRSMGAKGRAFAESSWSYEMFGVALTEAVNRAGSTR